MTKVSVFAPISIGNVSVGFDSLGLAVVPIDGTLLGDIVHIELSTDNNDHLKCVGDYQHILPQKKEENIIWQCLLEFNKLFQRQGNTPQNVSMTLEKNIPICSGLGSSACSVVAGLNALNEFYQKPFLKNDLLILMGQLEAQISGSLHYDNVAPCYLGGLQLMLEGGEKVCQSLPTFDDCYWVISYPDIPVSTKMAREILPEHYSRADVILTAKRFAAFVDACYRQDKQQAFSVLKDVVAEPYRISLLGDFDNTKRELLKSGCLAVGISGSGPTLFAVCDSLEKAEKAKLIFDETYVPKDKNKNGFTHICKTDKVGSRTI
jgi:homoserine kinase